MVERILAKAKQSGATLNQLVGVAIGQSPTKNRTDFVDVHAAGKSVKKSWHFSVKEVPKSTKQSREDKQMTLYTLNNTEQTESLLGTAVNIKD